MRRSRSRPAAARNWSCRARAPAASSAPGVGSAPGTSTTGKLAWRTFTIPAPGEPGSETWKDNHNAWRVGGGGVWKTASFDPATNLLFYGTGDAFPSFDPEFRPGDNLFTASTIALDADTGKITWYFQETPNEHWDFDTPCPKMLYDVNINGETRKVVANFSRNGFYYTLDRTNGQFLRADQYQEKVTWTKGIDPKTGKPVDYNPNTPVQHYAGIGVMRAKRGEEACPWWNGSPTFFPPTLDAKRGIAYVAGAEGCIASTTNKTPMDENEGLRRPAALLHRAGPRHRARRTLGDGPQDRQDRRQGNVPAADRVRHAEHRRRSPVHRATCTASSPPMTTRRSRSFGASTSARRSPHRRSTYSVNGKQYIAVVAGGAVGVRQGGVVSAVRDRGGVRVLSG